MKVHLSLVGVVTLLAVIGGLCQMFLGEGKDFGAGVLTGAVWVLVMTALFHSFSIKKSPQERPARDLWDRRRPES